MHFIALVLLVLIEACSISASDGCNQCFVVQRKLSIDIEHEKSDSLNVIVKLKKWVENTILIT